MDYNSHSDGDSCADRFARKTTKSRRTPMNLEKFWLAAGAVEAKNEDDGYTVMVLPDGT